MNGRNVRISDPNHVLLALTGVTRINEHTVEVPVANFPNGFAINGDSTDSIHLNDAGLNIVGDLTLSAGLIVQTQPIQVAGTTTLDAGPTGSIMLDNAGNDFGVVDGRRFAGAGQLGLDVREQPDRRFGSWQWHVVRRVGR